MRTGRLVKRSSEQEEIIRDLAKRARIDSWTEFVETLQVPSELVPALVANRVELIRLAQPRDLPAEEVKALYTLIGALIETNMTLREHASNISIMLNNWVGSIHGMVGVADRIGRFAQFRHEEAAEPAEV